jgi:hypothetical protein
MADTMVTDDGRGVIRGLRPGQLKIVPLADRITIAYSGLVAPALDTIRQARRDLKAGIPLQDTISKLARATQDSRFEYIVCAHKPEPMLVKLWDGHVAQGADRYTLGDASPLERLPDVSKYDRDGKLPPHVRFQVSFIELFHNEGHHVAPTVGGFPVVRGATPAAHEYIDHHATIAWDTIQWPGGVTAEQAADRASGGTMFNYNCLVPRGGDAGVLGFYLPQPRMAFVYAPLLQDEAFVLREVSYKNASSEISRIAQQSLDSL